MPRSPAPAAPGQVAAVVVDHNAGMLLHDCVRSLLEDGAAPVVVVENGAPGSVELALAALMAERPRIRRRRGARRGRTLGYGAGVNRGLAALSGLSPPPPWVVVSNPDLQVHPGAIDELRAVLEARPAWALVGPRIYTDDGTVYPSVRRFPSFLDAAGHALLALFNPENRFTKRYNPGAPEGSGRGRGRLGLGLVLSGPRVARSKSWAVSTRRTSCTSRTRTCAGGPTGRAGGSGSPVPPASRTRRA